MQLEDPLHTVLHLSHDTNHVLCVSSAGGLTVLDTSLKSNTVGTTSTGTSLDNIMAAGVINTSGGRTRIVLIDVKGLIQVIKLDLHDPHQLQAEVVSEGWLGDTKRKDGSFTFADIGEDGIATALCK